MKTQLRIIKHSNAFSLSKIMLEKLKICNLLLSGVPRKGRKKW